MNTRELRIGNWVNCITNIGIKVGKICMLQDIMISADVLDGNNNRKCYGYIGEIQDGEIDFIEPIELTEQMLCNNGFEYVGEHEFDQRRCFLRYRGGDCIIIYCTPNHTDFRMTIRKDSTEISEFPCQYLHELQNLYYTVNKKELDFKF
jgi:hypothetical protein